MSDTFKKMEKVDIAGQIKAQFPAQLPPDDYQSEFIFGVKLDYRDWNIVIAALSARAKESTLPEETSICATCGFVLTPEVIQWCDSGEACPHKFGKQSLPAAERKSST